MNVIDQIYEQLDKGNVGIGIYLDLQKAFDTINHSILLRKMEHYGIRGVALKWFENYLQNRRQFVVANEIGSDIMEIKCGVPQGFVLGPLLFILYINDIYNYDTHCNNKGRNLTLFADDTNLFLFGKNLDVLIHQSNQELLLLKTWFQNNKLSLSIDKCTFSLFASDRSKLASNPPVFIDRFEIKRVKEVKFLGILIDEELKWSNHNY